MDRCRRGGALLRPTGAGCRKNRHRRPDLFGRGIRSSRESQAREHAGARKPRSALGYTQFAINSPATEQTFFGDEADTGAAGARTRRSSRNQTITWHLNGSPLKTRRRPARNSRLPSLERGTYIIAGHRSRIRQRRIADQRERDVLRAPAVSALAAAPRPLDNPAHRHGRSAWLLNSICTRCASRAPSCSIAW